MIIAEIKTDGGTYSINMAAATSLRDAYAVVKENLNGDGLFEGDELLVIGKGALIKHVRIFTKEEKITEYPVETAPTIVTQTKDGVILQHITTMYLGNRLVVDYLEHNNGVVTYYMIVFLNDDEPVNTLNAENQDKLMTHIADSNDFPLDGRPYVVVTAPGSLGDLSEYKAFFADYMIEDVIHKPGEEYHDDAKAWLPWKNK